MARPRCIGCGRSSQRQRDNAIRLKIHGALPFFSKAPVLRCSLRQRRHISSPNLDQIRTDGKKKYGGLLEKATHSPFSSPSFFRQQSSTDRGTMSRTNQNGALAAAFLVTPETILQSRYR